MVYGGENPDWKKELVKEYYLFSEELASRRRLPLFQGNFDEVQEVPQMCSAFSTPEKPVLATFGLANCIGLVAYDRDAKLAFLGHTDSFSFYHYYLSYGKVVKSAHVDKLWRGLRERGGEHKLEIYIVKGIFPEKEYIEIINNHLDRVDGTDGIKIISREEIDTGDDGSIAIDSRTGKLYSYDPKLNPNPRTPGPWDVFIKAFSKKDRSNKK